MSSSFAILANESIYYTDVDVLRDRCEIFTPQTKAV
jgi:hypothetical protein